MCLVNWKCLLYLYKMGGLEKKKTHKKDCKQNVFPLIVMDIFIACLLLLLLF